MFKKNQSGFSLVEVLIVSGMMAGLGYAIMNMSNTAMKATKSIEQRSEIHALSNELRAFLSLSKNCTVNFAGRSLSVLDADAVEDDLLASGEELSAEAIYVGKAAETAGDPPVQGDARYCTFESCQRIYGVNNVKIESMTLLDGLIPWDDNTTTEGSRIGKAVLDLRFIKIGAEKGATYGGKVIRQYVYLVTTIDQDDANKITECHALSTSDSDGLWHQNAVGIHYNSGNVGIGTDTPGNEKWPRDASILHVNNSSGQGAIMVSGSSPDNIAATYSGVYLYAENVGFVDADPWFMVQKKLSGDVPLEGTLASSDAEGDYWLGQHHYDADGNHSSQIAMVVDSAKGDIYFGGMLGSGLLPVDYQKDNPNVKNMAFLSRESQSAFTLVGAGDDWTYAASNLCALENGVHGGCWNFAHGTGKNFYGSPPTGGFHNLNFFYNPAGTTDHNIRVSFASDRSAMGIGTGTPGGSLGSLAHFLHIAGDNNNPADLILSGTSNTGSVHYAQVVLAKGGSSGNLSDAWYMAFKPPGDRLEIGREYGTKPYMYIESDGKVHVGTAATTASPYVFEVHGYSFGNEWITPSDKRLKKNIIPLKNSLEKIKTLTGVTHEWRVDEFPEKQLSHEKSIGLIAQEVEKVFPEVIISDSDGLMGVNYGKMVPILIESVKELHLEIEKLRKEISDLKKTQGL